MITQQNMYQLFYDNQNYLKFIINQFFKKVETNEKTYEVMINNKVYLKFLNYNNNYSKQTQINIIKTLNRFTEKFWLQKSSLAFLKVIKYVKSKKITKDMACKIIEEEKLVNGFYAYLKNLELLTKISQHNLIKINNIYETFGINEAIKYLVKNKFIK